MCCSKDADRQTDTLAHHRLHHVWLGVAQCLGSKEHVHYAVVTNHFQDHGAGAESAAPAAAVPEDRKDTQTDKNSIKT